MDFEEKTLKRTEIFDGHIFKVVVDDVELPNDLGQAKRELIFHRGAVAVLAVTDENKIILVKQYRKAIEKISYEIFLFFHPCLSNLYFSIVSGLSPLDGAKYAT